MELLKKCPYLPLKQKWPTSTLPGHYFQADLQKEVRQRGKGETGGKRQIKGKVLHQQEWSLEHVSSILKAQRHTQAGIGHAHLCLRFPGISCTPIWFVSLWSGRIYLLGAHWLKGLKGIGRYECLWAHFNQHKLLATWKKALPPPLRPTLPILSYRGRFKSPPPTCNFVLSDMEHLKTRGRG